ncbi:MAG TPA: 3-phosphoshikimate 1-carboxyvinyltransferase [Streptosporangiaceae bacterium]|jgi:3-phosphoshikimate 1-carboxyvinyltransferase
MNEAERSRASAGAWLTPAATGPVQARLRLPGSKSITNRALVLAALADAGTTITGPLRARDTELMAGALRALGAVIDEVPGGWAVTPGQMDHGAQITVGNAGTVIRFVPPVAVLATGDVTFRGDPEAARRPVGPLLAALAALGAGIDDGGRGAVPFTVRGTGGLPGGRVTLDASGSSQLVSGLLLSGCRYDKGLEIRHQGPPVPSAPHIAMTAGMLRAAGVDVEEQVTGSGTAGGTGAAGGSGAAGGPRPDAWRVHPGPLRPGTIEVEPDLVNSAPFLAAALITGGTVTIAGWPERTTQPGEHIVALLSAMGGDCALGPDGLTVTGPGAVRGITASLRDCGEVAPVFTAAAALASSPSVLTGIGHMRRHETDRLAALCTELNALGGDVRELPDGLEIRPRPLRAAGVFGSYHDHRMVMTAAVLGLAVPGVQVANAATVAKTFPEFTRLWSEMLGDQT